MSSVSRLIRSGRSAAAQRALLPIICPPSTASSNQPPGAVLTRFSIFIGSTPIDPLVIFRMASQASFRLCLTQKPRPYGVCSPNAIGTNPPFSLISSMNRIPVCREISGHFISSLKMALSIWIIAVASRRATGAGGPCI